MNNKYPENNQIGGRKIMKNIAKTIHQILGNQEMSPIEVEAELNELVDELIQKKQELKKPAHWPGMYIPSGGSSVYAAWSCDMICTSHETLIKGYQLLQICCKTTEERDFVLAHQKANLAVINELARLNEGWRPDWKNDDPKWEPHLQIAGEILILSDSDLQGLPDWFQAKSKEIWLQVIENLGEGKVKLALWPIYEEAK